MREWGVEGVLLERWGCGCRSMMNVYFQDEVVASWYELHRDSKTGGLIVTPLRMNCDMASVRIGSIREQ
jgi:hypothetical protein